jgi:nucleotide-binding universal stress UspA family protein
MRVLAATDLGKSADEAVRQAAELAGPSGVLGAIHVLPTLDAVSVLFPQQHFRAALDVAQILARATDAVRERVSRVGGRDAEIFIEEGIAYAEIVRRAEACGADLVVLGSHGD